jgi:hypothetical protein
VLQILTGKSADPIELQIDKESWKNKFKKWSERTTTLPSGLHLGHNKTLITTYFKETECHVDQEIKKIQDELFETVLTISNMAIITQTPLTRWKEVDNLIIPKKANAQQINNSKIYTYMKRIGMQ